MPRASRPWFRQYVSMFQDPRIRALTPTNRWLYVAMEGAARASCHPGALMVSETRCYTDAQIADFAGMREVDVRKGLVELESADLIERGEAGCWVICDWDDLQYESDTSTTRVAKHRARGTRCNGQAPLQRGKDH